MSTSEVQLPPLFVEKRGAAWGPVRVEHYRLRAGELPEHAHRQHLLLVSLSGCSGEMWTAGGMRARAQARGGVCVIPSGEPFATRVRRESEALGIYLDPDLVERAARDLQAQELDGIDNSNEGVLILGATNTPWNLDPAFRRPGRFDRIIFVPPPDEPTRESIL